MPLTKTQIDNVDPRVVYGGVWTTHPSDDAFNNTMSLTRRVGNTATVVFTGNSIAVYGTLGEHPPDAPAITKYEIDDADPVTFAPPSPSVTLRRLLFFQSPSYPYGPHKLVMTNMVDLDWIWLDFFEVTSNDGPSTTTISSPTFIPGGALTPSSSSNSNSPSASTIVGATLGGLAGALIIAGTVMFFFWRKKRHAGYAQQHMIETDTYDPGSSYRPFRGSAMVANIEQQYQTGQIIQSNSVISVPIHAHESFPSESTNHPFQGTIPPAKMRHESHIQTEPASQLPVYST